MTTTVEWTQAADLRARFWAYVEQRGPDECWVWRRGRFANGYGQFRVGKRKMKAHRVAYQLMCGPIPDRQILRHSCDNPPCCNPRHLLTGTHAENSADRDSRGRANRALLPVLSGELNPAAKLRADQVTAIRARVASGERRCALALEYGVSGSLVGQIVRGLAWRPDRAEGL